MEFSIHERLCRSGVHFGDYESCYVLLKNESTFPWFILVPKVSSDLEDLHQLPPEMFDKVTKMIRVISDFVGQTFQTEKLNVGCIGNQVRQMHIHIIGRYLDDLVWPNPVWGAKFDKKPYPDRSVEEIKAQFEKYILNQDIEPIDLNF